MKKLLVGILLSLSLFVNAGTARYTSTDGAFKLTIIDLPNHRFYNGQVFKYSFPSSTKRRKPSEGVVTIITANNNGRVNSVMDGTLTLLLNENLIKSTYKAKFDEDDSLVKFRINYKGTTITFVRDLLTKERHTSGRQSR
jgi:hypothetical protein